jgi:hypothetical protein
VADRDALDIKLALSDPEMVLNRLGLMGKKKEHRKQGRGWLIRCPLHKENTPSCSVQQKGGIIVWKCWGCGATGDVLNLIAIMNDLKIDTEFKQVLLEGAKLAGLWQLVDELEGRAPRADRPVLRLPEPEPERPWPNLYEVARLWSACTKVDEDEQVSKYLRGRAIDPTVVARRDLARVVGSEQPWWASYRGDAPVSRSWNSLGYRLIVPMFDHEGSLRSVRAWRVTEGEPKRLPAIGKAGELVMADPVALNMLRRAGKPWRVTIVEGEPDFLTRASITEDERVATLGIVSGSWTPAFAERVPLGARVFIRTDVDNAGNRYADNVVSTLRRRAFIWRLQA